MDYTLFSDFFNVVSATIPDDDYFEMFLQNTFGMLSMTPQKHIYAGAGIGSKGNFDFKNGYVNDFHRNI